DAPDGPHLAAVRPGAPADRAVPGPDARAPGRAAALRGATLANDKQFKLRTKYIGTRGVREYRETIASWVNKNDVVLEIGCEWGTTTGLIAPYCKEVIGTDISPECIEVARKKHPDICFEVLDAFDMRTEMS